MTNLKFLTQKLKKKVANANKVALKKRNILPSEATTNRGYQTKTAFNYVLKCYTRDLAKDGNLAQKISNYFNQIS